MADSVWDSNLKAVRMSRHLTQAEVSAMTGIPASSLAKWEQGLRRPKIDAIQRLADLYRVPVNDLLRSDLLHRGSVAPIAAAIVRGEDGAYVHVNGGDHPVSSDTLARHPDCYYLAITDDSVDRIIPDGYLALVDPDGTASSGDLAVVSVGGEVAVVRRLLVASGILVLRPESHNPSWHQRTVDTEAPGGPGVTFMGRVIGATTPEDWRP